jgi:hypothetical protein
MRLRRRLHQFRGPPQQLHSSSSKLLQFCILCSGGRKHAHGMAEFLQFHSSTMLGAFPQAYAAIYRESKPWLWPS